MPCNEWARINFHVSSNSQVLYSILKTNKMKQIPPSEINIEAEKKIAMETSQNLIVR